MANSISHGLGLVAAIATIPVFIRYSMENRDFLFNMGLIVFSITLIILYFASSIYHLLPVGKPKKFFQSLDHIAIFLLIAGTYTPFALGILRGPWGWTLFGLIWLLAFIGIFLELFGKLGSGKVSNSLYLAMGWSAILVIKPMIMSIPAAGLTLILAGGIFYSLGIYFYAHERRYYHFIWHIFVVFGSISHFTAIFLYA